MSRITHAALGRASYTLIDEHQETMGVRFTGAFIGKLRKNESNRLTADS
jgi:hypothetical protein